MGILAEKAHFQQHIVVRHRNTSDIIYTVQDNLGYLIIDLKSARKSEIGNKFGITVEKMFR